MVDSEKIYQVYLLGRPVRQVQMLRKKKYFKNPFFNHTQYYLSQVNVVLYQLH